MIVKRENNAGNSVTALADKKAFQNAVKLALLGHDKFVTQKALQLDANYIYLKEGMKTEQILLK